MSNHLTPLDATFLELEEADPSAQMHIGAIMVFDPPPNVFFGVIADPDAVPDLDVSLSAMEDSVEQLLSETRGDPVDGADVATLATSA
jgi:hypothetical protein